MSDDLGPVVWSESSTTLVPSSTSIPFVAVDHRASYSFGVDENLARLLLTRTKDTRFELRLDHHGVMLDLHVPGVELRLDSDPEARRCVLISATALVTEPPEVPEAPAYVGLAGSERTLATMADQARRIDRSPLRELRIEQMRSMPPYHPRNPYSQGDR